jgi:hypothetical protein
MQIELLGDKPWQAFLRNRLNGSCFFVCFFWHHWWWHALSCEQRVTPNTAVKQMRKLLSPRAANFHAVSEPRTISCNVQVHDHKSNLLKH